MSNLDLALSVALGIGLAAATVPAAAHSERRCLHRTCKPERWLRMARHTCRATRLTPPDWTSPQMAGFLFGQPLARRIRLLRI